MIFKFFPKKRIKEELSFSTFLPQLTDDLNYSSGTEGEWISCSDTILGDVVNFFPVYNLSQLHEDEFSIPSPWAKYILFEMLLLKPLNDDLHKRVQGEWRGLIALLAANKLLNIDIDVEVIDISTLEGLEKDLGNVLTKTIPQNALFTHESASLQVGLICLKNGAKNHLIGMVSKSTIVCTPYLISDETSIILSRQVPWCFKDGRFVDPLVKCKDVEVRSAIKLWLEAAKEGLNIETLDSSSNSFRTERTVLRKLIEKYLSDIILQNNRIASTILPVSRKRGHISNDSVFALVDLCFKRQEVNRDSDLEVIVEGKGTKLIIVDEAMWNISYFSEKAGEIFLYDNVRYNNWNPNIPSGMERIGSSDVPKDYYLMNAKDIFLPTLYLFPSPNYFDTDACIAPRVAFNDMEYSVIWPVNEKIFEYVPANVLKKNLNIFYDADDNSVMLTLKLLVRGPEFIKSKLRNTNVMPITFSKKYRNDSQNMGYDEIILNLSHINGICIWPYRRFNKNMTNLWSKYMLVNVKEKFVGRAERYEFEPIYEKGVLKNKEIRYDKLKGDYDCSVLIASDIPSYLRVKIIDNLGMGYCDMVAGAVFLKDIPSAELSNNSPVDIAVDFGTSSTTIYKREGRRPPEFVAYGKRYFIDYNNANSERHGFTLEKETEYIKDDIYNVVNDDKLRNIVDCYFIPQYYLNRDLYLSVFEKLVGEIDGSKWDMNSNAFEVGHIFFLSTRELTALRKENLLKNLKWGSNQNDVAKAYLLQIMLQATFSVMGSGYSEVNWRFSYPTALGIERINSFEERIIENIKAIASSTGCSMRLAHYASESEACAVFYQKAGVFRGPGPNDVFVCIDIGGSSTDVSIWKSDFNSNGNKAQTSFAFASRDMFLTTILRSKAAQALLGEYFDTSISNAPKEFYAEIESMLLKDIDLIREKYININETERKSISKKISIGVAGIFYYVLMLIKHLVEIETVSNFNNICFFLSGNGSRCMEWVPKEVRNGLSAQIRTILRNEFGFDGNVSIEHDSGALKTEAGKGLLYMEPNQQGNGMANEQNRNINEIVISGEKVFFDYYSGSLDEFKWDTDLSKLSGNIDALENTLERLKRIWVDPSNKAINGFIDFFNEVWEKTGHKDVVTINSNIMKMVVSSAEGRIITTLRDKMIEPAFIAELRYLLQHIN